jgi:succinate dehydrogenase / fumarate reductase cytochrome b subunit
MSAPGHTLPRHFWLRRLHSLTGIVPVGGFLAFHLFENYAATKGPDAYNEMTRKLQQVPFAVALEIFVIALPLFFHGIYGLFLTTTSRPNPISSPYVRNAMYLVQRITGVIVFAFILFHYWTTRLVQLHDHESLNLFNQVQAAVANPWIYAFYLVGILSATFHALVSVAAFVVLSIFGVRSIAAFRL